QGGLNDSDGKSPQNHKGAREARERLSEALCLTVFVAHLQSHPSMNLRFRSLIAGMEKIEITTPISLRNMRRIQGAESSIVSYRRHGPFLAPARQISIAHFEMQFATRHVQLDQIAIADKCQWPADVRLRRDVQNARTVRGSAHSCVRNSN